MMANFSSVYPKTDAEVRKLVSKSACPSKERLEELLEESDSRPLTLGELAGLLEIGRAPAASGQFEALRAHVLGRCRKATGNAVRYVAPIYVSSFCIDACAYCNFSAQRKSAVRKRLSLAELDTEIETVYNAGARVIELVYATDPEFTTELLARYTERVVESLKGEPGSGALLCTEYLSREAYEELAAAGLHGIVQWDETLDAAAYHRWHDSSPHKREFATRMDNHDRAMQAGLEVATGALLGLADYRYDALMQIAKARHLAGQYGHGPFVFGVPRLKPIAGRELHFQTEVSDRAYETVLLVYRLAAPETGRWLQTRETFEMNLRNLLDGDVFTYRCGDVRPGGYHQIDGKPAVQNGQFGVNELERDYVEAELARHGFQIGYGWTKAIPACQTA
jgi:2-iminoacetate synthase